jgi:SH3-like domain-containing protein
MKIMLFAFVTLPLAAVVLAGCGPRQTPAIDKATVNAEHSSLRVRNSDGGRTIRVLEPGDQVEILEQQGGWYRVRAGDVEGWIETSRLLPDSVRNRMQENIDSARKQLPQNTGVLAEHGNLRIEPGRTTAVLRLVPAGTAVEVLERKTLPREDVPGRVDAWLKVRTSPTEVGWLLSSFVEFDVPEVIAPYTEEYIYSAVKTLNQVADPVAGTVRWYVVGERKPGTNPTLDFEGIRVFTWNSSRQRYETAFRKQGLRGVYPLEVGQDAGKPTFRIYELDTEGKKKIPKDYVMNGVIVRELTKSGG